MKVGTKSLLFGAHAFWLHPWFVLAAWIRLYGWPMHPAIWLSLVVHDWGYWGLDAIDDARGEEHPEVGARIVGKLFGAKWHGFVRYHSRFLAARDGQPISKLCIADKYALTLIPSWLYLPMARATGEIKEYMALAERGKYMDMVYGSGERAWYAGVQKYLRAWVLEHKEEASP